jgi:tRNA nucleotidyltransferase (CCA-adding enzyme)
MRALPDSPREANSPLPGSPRDLGPDAVLRRFHALPADRLALLRQAAEIAGAVGSELAWVGGGVRDLCFETSAPDIDLVVDTGLVPFAERFAARLGSRIVFHPQFMTAELRAPDGIRIDLAQRRSEFYPAPAALPRVSPGTVESDTARRDFTINCMSIPLAPEFGTRLVDSAGGLRDLSRRQLRILHGASFRDDPTRILRGLEFEARFELEWEAKSLAAAQSAIAGDPLSLLSPARLGEALHRALGRPETSVRVLRRMNELGLPAAIDPALTQAGAAAARLEAALREPAGRGLGSAFRLALLALACESPAESAERVAARLGLAKGERDLWVEGPARIRRAAAALATSPPASAVHRCLESLSDEELLVVSAAGSAARSWVRLEVEEYRPLRLRVGGRELIAAGARPGPALGRALAETLRARLDGEIGASEEFPFALRWLSAAERDLRSLREERKVRGTDE